MVLDKEQIQKQAKQLLDKFALALETIDEKGMEEGYVDRDEFERIEGEGRVCEEGFKQNMLENAPEHDDEFILVERGNWK